MFAVIGDLVASRQLDDRERSHLRLDEVLRQVNSEVPAEQPLAPTVGDEIQGVWREANDWLRATFLTRLRLMDEVDVRFGVGFGEITVIDQTRVPWIQDGSAWWQARASLEVLSRRSNARRRTWLLGGSPSEQQHLNALVTCRDSLLDELSDRGRRVLDMAIRGMKQTEIAAAEGVSAAAISQQFSGGVRALLDSYRLLEPS